MCANFLSLNDLPNELLISLLTSFPTGELLPLVLVSRRFHSIILRILHYRLLLAATLPDYVLILEAYHPAKKWSEPYLFCSYLGTDGLSSKHEGHGSLYEDCDGAAGRLAKLGSLYSTFRPEMPGIQGSMPQRFHPAGGPGLPAGSDATSQPILANGGDGGQKKVIHNIHLDGHELFSQFCAYGTLVKMGPRHGIHASAVRLVKPGEGVMRVWRDWLQTQAENCVKDLKNGRGRDGGSKKGHTRKKEDSVHTDNAIRWTDYNKNFGLRFEVQDRLRHDEPAAQEQEDLPVSYSVEIKAPELVVRTTHLMLAVEKAKEEQLGKSIIFGTFATAD